MTFLDIMQKMEGQSLDQQDVLFVYAWGMYWGKIMSMSEGGVGAGADTGTDADTGSVAPPLPYSGLSTLGLYSMVRIYIWSLRLLSHSH